MLLKNINFGDVDAKNEILKQKRTGERVFFDSFSVPNKIDINDYFHGRKYFIMGLKGTGKTALLRYLHDKVIKDGETSELILFKTHVSEEDRKQLSKNSGYEIISTDGIPAFSQDFKESWKWMIYQRIALNLYNSGVSGGDADKLYKFTNITKNTVTTTLGTLFSKVSSGRLKFSGEAFGVAVELGIEAESEKDSVETSLASANRACAEILNTIILEKKLYIFFDELELFYQTSDQFDRDRRIIRDLIYAISHINGDSAENGRKIYVISSLRTEVLHSVLELGHEIGRDVDDYGDKLDWFDAKDSKDHPLLRLISKKIAISANILEEEVWNTFFPEKINNQDYFRFILNSSYYRPRDIVRLLRVARDYDSTSAMFTTAHFDQTSIEYSKQTWLEITEELLASYSAADISSLQRFLLGFSTHFFKSDIQERLSIRYKSDRDIQNLFNRKGISNILSDLYRIGVVGNDFVSKSIRGKSEKRNRWVFRGNTTLNDAERMAIHKSLWKHLSLIPKKTH